MQAAFSGHVPGLLGATAAYAVLVPVAETAEGLSLLYEVRSPALHHHSGEVCFPGGRMEPGETPEQCASVLRRYKHGGDWTPDDMTRGLFYRGVE